MSKFIGDAALGFIGCLIGFTILNFSLADWRTWAYAAAFGAAFLFWSWLHGRYSVAPSESVRTFRPSPMPTVARARIYLPDAQLALDRAAVAWNPTQMTDAIRSLRTFLNQAEEALRLDEKKEGAE